MSPIETRDPSEFPADLEQLVQRALAGTVRERRQAMMQLASAFPAHADAIRVVLGGIDRLRGEVDALATGAAGESAHPESLGPYRILGLLGEGGMGTVFLAERREPVRQRVALKLIKVGMDTKQVLARFGAEHQALAMMEHDNIAKVLDAGCTGDGRPYFVMEYVKGVPIADYCDAHKLTIDERLRLFQPVCYGVQHAHQKGVIHRDLKPSNVLVTVQSGHPVPKIIDFGLARAMDHRLVEATLFTQQGQILGTPGYMSPEQAGLGGLDIDTRTDVYSLGVMLYELLTGEVPLMKDDGRAGDLLEMQRVIREVDPPKPSTRISMLGVGRAVRARALRVDAGVLRRRLSGDLDWITMKALEKDRVRRYETAAALADDLRRHLEHEPVHAGPPSAGYRLRKLARRYRVSLAAGAAVLLALAIGLIVALSQRNRAERAKAELKTALSLKEDALVGYERMRDVPLCDDLMREAERELWPAHPHLLTALEAWIPRARALVVRTAGHRQRLEEIRARALPVSAEVSRKEVELAELRRQVQQKQSRLELARKRKSRAAARAAMGLVQELGRLESRIESLDEKLAPLRWSFADYNDRFRHSVLAALVPKLDRLAEEVLPSVEARRRLAASLTERSIEMPKQAWENAACDLAKANGVDASKHYAGMPRLTPQLGLVPLGMDPKSLLHEFAVLDTGVVPERDDDGRLAIDGEAAIVLVLVPPGSFLMGAQRTDRDQPNFHESAEPDESPVHSVELDAFFLSKYEMTQGQWERIMDANPSVHTEGPAPGGIVTRAHPVESVTWWECETAMRRCGLRIPTESQWEYAARGATTTPWWTGSTIASLQGACNIADAYARANNAAADWRVEEHLDDGYTVHAPVGTFRANGYGLHDTAGNVWEWCRDGYYFYDTDPKPGSGLRVPANPRGRVFRGGGYAAVAVSARSSYRRWYEPERRAYVGIRPARAISR